MTRERGHCRIFSTAEKIKNYYYWENMTKDTAEYVKSCQKCHLEKTIQQESPIMPFDTVHADKIESFPRSINGNKYAITLICDLTKYLVTVPIPDISAKLSLNRHLKTLFLPMIQSERSLQTWVQNTRTLY